MQTIQPQCAARSIPRPAPSPVQPPHPVDADGSDDRLADVPGVSVTRALATAKTHFVARGWRPLSINPPSLDHQCRDVSALLLMSEEGETVWLSARDWSALSHPVDGFRREMVCVRQAKVAQAILVYDGEFPEAVVEAAAQEPGLKLVDAVALREMTSAGMASGGAVAAATMSRRARLTRPARDAVASLQAHATRVVDTRLLPATERFVSKRLAQTLRRMDGERRRLRNLVTGGLIVMGFAIGFLVFNLVVLTRTPDDTDTGRTRVATTTRPALPVPTPPPQGYIAQAAGVPAFAARSRPAPLPRMATSRAAMSASRAAAPMPQDVVASSATPQTGLDDFALAQMRADEAMRVIAHDTPEIHAAGRMAASWQRESAASRPSAMPTALAVADPARVGGEPAVPDPAEID